MDYKSVQFAIAIYEIKFFTNLLNRKANKKFII